MAPLHVCLQLSSQYFDADVKPSQPHAGYGHAQSHLKARRGVWTAKPRLEEGWGDGGESRSRTGYWERGQVGIVGLRQPSGIGIQGLLLYFCHAIQMVSGRGSV